MKLRVLFLLIVLFGAGSICRGQLDRASLSGTVSDTSGSVVPETKITATQVTTQTNFSASTNDSGTYNFIGLPIGEYTVTAEKAGFSRIVRQSVVLTASSYVRVDLVLSPGIVTEQVEVNASTPLVEERSSAYGVNVQTRTLEQLPLQVSGSKRSLYSYLLTVPGAQNVGFANNIMGGVGMYSQVVMDGVTAEYNAAVQGVMQRPPSVETIAEFKVVNSVAAEYGLTGGAFMSFISKSGTNELHGDAYDYLRNNALDARSFFARQVAIQKQNEFGFTLGGPLIVPHVYNGRNKTFFFGNFTQYIFHSTASGTVLTLPTDAFKAGDFSALLGSAIGTDALDRPVRAGQIYDPASTRSDGKGGLIRDPFQGNIIPASRVSPVSAKFQSFLPPLTFPSSLTNNFVGASGLNITKEDSYFLRLDQMIGKGRLYGSYKLARGSSSSACVLPSFFCGGSGQNRAQSWRAAYNRPLSARAINDLMFGVDRLGGPGSFPNPDEGKGAISIGLKGTFNPCTPQITIQGGYPGEPYFGNHVCAQGEADTNWKLNESVGFFVGKHTLKFGGSYYRWAANFPTVNRANGLFNFSAPETGLPSAGFDTRTGFGYASFLLGEVDSAQIQAPQTSGQREWYLGFFIQDEYRISPKLTINYGVRYDYQPQFTAPHDDISEFDPSVPNPKAGGLPGAMTFLGKGPGRNGRRRYSDTYKFGFGPRFGFSYSLASSTVIRGSYGLFNAPVSQNQFAQVSQHQGFVPQFGVSSLDGVTPAFNWTNGFPVENFNINPSIDPAVANGSSTSFVGRINARPAHVQMLNFGIQHQLPRSIVVEAAYLGNLSHHIATTSLESVNQLDYAKYGRLGSLLNADINSPAAVAAGFRAPFAGFVGTVSQALRPFPQYLGINGITSAIGSSTYHAVQLKVQKQYSSGLSFLIGYTVSKTLTDIDSTPGYFAAGPQNAYDRHAEKALSSVDYPHSVVASYTYDLPIGPGKKLLNGRDVFRRYIAGGWSLSGIHSYRSGSPLGVVTNTRLPATGDTLALSNPTIRPNRVSGVSPLTGLACSGFDPGRDTYLNRAAFSNPAPFTFGNAPRLLSDVRGCPAFNENFSLMKHMPITEHRIDLRLGADFFNVLNRRNLGNPSTNIDNLNYGKISGAGPGRTTQLHMKLFW